MAIPTIFAQKVAPFLASYDWIDFAEGSGSVKFYGFAVNLSAGLSYVLNRETAYSTTSGYNGSADRRDNNNYHTSTNTTGKIIDLDMDTLAFNTARLVGGTCLLNVPWSLGFEDTASKGTFHLVAVIKKLATDGTTETDLLTLTSNTLGNTAAGSNATSYSNVYFTLKGEIPKTKISLGEKIRITLEFYVDTLAVGKSIYPAIFLESNNLAVTLTAPYVSASAGYSALTIQIPFKITN